MNEKTPLAKTEIREAISKNGLIDFIAGLPRSAYNETDLITDVAEAASNRNQLLTADDRSRLQDLDGSDFFALQSILRRVIPLLHANPEELMELVFLLVEKGGEDLAANQPNVAFREWCEADLSRADEVIALARTNNSLALSHLVFALQAKGDCSEALKSLAGVQEEQTAGVLALSRMQLDRTQTIQALEETVSLANKTDTKTAAGIIKAAYDLASKHDDIDRNPLVVAVGLLSGSNEPFTIHMAASVLHWHHKEMGDEEIKLCLAQIERVDPKNKGTIDEIDNATASMWDQGHVSYTSELVFALLKNSSGAIDREALDAFFHKITHGNAEYLAQLATDWFLRGDFFPCVELNWALSEINKTVPCILPDEVLLPPACDEQIFVCRKAVGYLFTHPMTAAVWSVAVLKNGHADAKQIAADLLFDPLLLNYGGALKDWLEDYATKNGACAGKINDALARAKLVWDGFEDARDVVELQPSESERAVVNFQKMEEAERIHNGARKQSVFSDLFTTQHLLYGDRSAFNIMTSSDELESKTMPFSEIKIKTELPKGVFFDPVGLDLMLDFFRRERLVSK